MASAFRKHMGCIASKLMQPSCKLTVSTGSKHVCAPQLATRGLTLKRGFWCISSVNNKHCTLINNQKRRGCRSVHTEGDQELVKLLTKEIADEKGSRPSKVVAIDGWDSSIDGADVTLSRQNGDELISVKFNVNDSVDADLDGMDENFTEDQAQPPQMVSKPLFSVTIKKKSGKVMDFSCSFSEEDMYDDGADGEDKLADQFSIVDMTIHSGEEAADSDYVLNGNTMDNNVYNLLMDMLDERGITDEFVTDLTNMSTAIEHNEYVKFLEDLKTTIKE